MTTAKLEINAGNRIDYIDGLRAIAILAVMMFHYNKLTKSFYGDIFYQDATEYGSYGVQLFFMVSGYVIAMTIEKCASWQEFLVRRFSRLWPTLLLCGLLTYIIVNLILTRRNSHVALCDFAPSLTMIHPRVYRAMFKSAEFDWIDASYWTLAIEIKFYVVYGVLFWIARKKVLMAFFVYMIGVSLVYVFLAWRWGEDVSRTFDFITIARHAPWFFLGICTFTHKKNSILPYGAYLVAGTLIILTLVAKYEFDSLVILPYKILANFVVFAIWILSYKSIWVQKFLSVKILSIVGVASYSLYLLHQEIGLTLIFYVSDLFAFSRYQVLLVAILVGCFMTAVSYIIYAIYEKPANRWIVTRLKFNKKQV